MKSIKICAILLILTASGLYAGDSDDSKRYYEESHAKYEKFLENGNVYEKLEAIAWMSSLRKYRFIRPLSRELLHGMEDPTQRKMAAFDPYIKSQIAIAIGEVGRKEGLASLTKALEFSNAILEEQRKAFEAKANKAAEEKSFELPVPANKYGPALMKEGYLYPVSPDAYWSIANDFKALDYDPNDEQSRIRMEGYNYVNVIYHVLVAISKLGDEKSLDLVTPFLDHPYSDVRLGAVVATTQLGSDKARDILLEKYAKETDDVVKARMASGILQLDTRKSEIYSDLVEKYLRHDNVKVRFEAARGLENLALGESLFHLHDAFLLETNQQVKNMLIQAIHNANADNILPPNPIYDTGPTKIWVYGEPVQPRESGR